MLKALSQNHYQHTNHYGALIITLLMLSFPVITQAHEFWIEPTSYHIDKGEPIIARLKVGQNLVGTPQVYLPKRFKAFNITSPDNTQAVLSRMGNDPAVNQSSTTEGLNILSYVSKDSTVTYDNAATFQSFLKKEGIEWVLATHKKRGLPDQGFTEAFQRFAKSLVQVSQQHGENSKDNTDNDRALGLRFELIAENNPYTTQQAIPIRLLWENKPFADAQINVFRRHDNQLTKTQLHTDSDGRALLEHQPGDYLLNAVHMIDPTLDNNTEETTPSAVWKSLWASLTFQIP